VSIIRAARVVLSSVVSVCVSVCLFVNTVTPESLEKPWRSFQGIILRSKVLTSSSKRSAVAAQTARSRSKVLSIQYVYYFRAYRRQRTLRDVEVISKQYFVIFAAFKESMTLNLAQRSFKVISDFGTSRKRVYIFLLVVNSNLEFWTLCCTILQIRRLKCRKSTIFTNPTRISAKIWGCSLWNRSVTLGSAESEQVRLISREIIFAEFQPIWSRYLNVTDRRTDRRTDNLPWQYSAPLGFARYNGYIGARKEYVSLREDLRDEAGSLWYIVVITILVACQTGGSKPKSGDAVAPLRVHRTEPPLSRCNLNKLKTRNSLAINVRWNCLAT